MRLRELVRAPAFTCTPGTTLAQAAHLMHLHDVGSLVVISDSAVAGIVTDRDLAVKGYGGDLAGTAIVEQVMTHSVVTIGIDADVGEAATTMLDHGVRRLPVMDGTRLCGVVALDDVVIFQAQESDVVRRTLAAQARKDAPTWVGWDEA